MAAGNERSEGQGAVLTAASPHVLVFPFPAQGHVNSMLKLAELLSLAGLHVTFLNTDYNHTRLSRFSPTFSRLALHPNFRFRSISDGLPDDQPRSVNRLWDLEQSLRTRAAAPLRELLLSLIRHQPSDDGWPALTCVIVDGIMMYAADVAEGLGTPAIAFRTISAACIWAYLCIPSMIRGGDLPFPDDADLDEPIRSAPGMEGFLRRRDLPKPCRDAKHADDYFLQFLSTVTEGASRARGLILNTLQCLEGPLLSRIRSHHCPVTYALGPLHSLLATYSSRRGPACSSGSMWEEDRSCMDWLDTQPPRSVVYVSFGSFTVVTREELLEFWHGLVDCGHPFLWVARPGMVGEEMAAPTAEVEEATRERGRLVGWAPQAEVLGHPAVGCFLTHSGWNSTLESVAAGMPMICWPFFADQQTNSRVVSEVWGVGMDMKDSCSRSIVAGMVREVMAGGEEGEAVRRSAAEKAEMARGSVEEGGSSYVDLQRLIQHIASFSS